MTNRYLTQETGRGEWQETVLVDMEGKQEKRERERSASGISRQVLQGSHRMCMLDDAIVGVWLLGTYFILFRFISFHHRSDMFGTRVIRDERLTRKII